MTMSEDEGEHDESTKLLLRRRRRSSGKTSDHSSSNECEKKMEFKNVNKQIDDTGENFDTF